MVVMWKNHIPQIAKHLTYLWLHKTEKDGKIKKEMHLGDRHHTRMPVVYLSNFDPLFLDLFFQKNTFDVLDMSRRKKNIIR